MKLRKLLSLSAIVLLSLTLDEVLAGGGNITGKVAFDGKILRRRKIKMDADAVCAAKHTEPSLSERVIVNEDSTLRNVFVYVREGLEGGGFEPPEEPVVLDQNGCMYVPHIVGIQVGQLLKILNSDGILHNIHCMPEENDEFNISMPKQLKEMVKEFEFEEVMMPVKCDVHPWMTAYIGVLEHPFYCVTGEKGTFQLNSLPPGEYVIEAWHEVFGTRTQTVKVGAGETKTIDFTFIPPSRSK